jgi:hypothetical protein
LRRSVAGCTFGITVGEAVKRRAHPVFRTLSGVLVAMMVSFAAHAQVLKVVEVAAPAINCVFRTNCTATVDDTSGNILLPTIAAGTAWLQSRTFTGEAGAPGAGTITYQYRVSLTEAAGNADCVVGFTLNFGPHVPLPYANNQNADVYVITAGAVGTIGVAKAERFGDVIDFTLEKSICVTGPANPGNTTFFVGLASTAAPMHVNAVVAVTGTTPIYAADARVPTHSLPVDPGQL